MFVKVLKKEKERNLIVLSQGLYYKTFRRISLKCFRKKLLCQRYIKKFTISSNLKTKIVKISEISVSYSNSKEEKLKVKNSKDSFEILLESWDKNIIELQEEFKILLLNRSNTVLGIYPMSKGGVSGTVVDAKLVFSVALKCNASSIIIAHNHPSGNLNPSEGDKKITEKLKKAGQYLDITLLDHLIITKDDFYSFSDNGLLK